ncbi:MAG: YciI family protein [Pseudomonadota bacterium]
MPLFLIHAIDKPGALDVRLANRADHLAWVSQHKDRVRMAGPLFSEDGETFAGSCFVLEADSLEAAQTWHSEDPYVRAGLFAHSQIHAFSWLVGAPSDT